VARLKETEEAYYAMIGAAAPPFSLIYVTDIKTGNVNYQTETADLSITTDLSTNKAWFTALEQALGAAKAVFEGLDATNRKNDWGLAKWPKEGVSDKNPFYRPRKYNIKVAFELINQQGRMIGNQIVELNPEFRINVDDGRFTVDVEGDAIGTVNFNGVRANDISDNLTIRVATVNGASPQNVRFTIIATALVEKSPQFTDTRNGKMYNTVKIGGKRWMAENLNYQPQTGQSWCYENDNSNCNKYGRLYDWNTATSVCPAGWHLPNSKEWDYLVKWTGGTMAGKKLKSKNGWNNSGNGTDDFGFSALPGGYRDGSGGSFNYAGYCGYWWTTEYGGDFAGGWNMRYGNDHVGEDGPYKSDGRSVRCVED
jgi:uncharacterized protein (TIGR02145 family)